MSTGDRQHKIIAVYQALDGNDRPEFLGLLRRAPNPCVVIDGRWVPVNPTVQDEASFRVTLAPDNHPPGTPFPSQG